MDDEVEGGEVSYKQTPPDLLYRLRFAGQSECNLDRQGCRVQPGRAKKFPENRLISNICRVEPKWSISLRFHRPSCAGWNMELCFCRALNCKAYEENTNAPSLQLN